MENREVESGGRERAEGSRGGHKNTYLKQFLSSFSDVFGPAVYVTLTEPNQISEPKPSPKKNYTPL